MRNETNGLVALLVASVLALAGSAQAQDDLQILALSPVPPNVMLVMDTSASMANAIFDDNFDPNVFYDLGPTAACTIGAVPEVVGSGNDTGGPPLGFCPGSGDAEGACPDGDTVLLATNKTAFTCPAATFPNGCADAPSAAFFCKSQGGNISFQLPDYSPGGIDTRWPLNYLHFLTSQMAAGVQPTQLISDRLEMAKIVLHDLVDVINPDGFNDNVLFGLADLDGGGSDANGAHVKAPVSSGNKNSMFSKITGLSPGTWSPLGEALTDVGFYLSGGEGNFWCGQKNSFPSSAPMTEFCRKNFIILITDGEPSMDDFDYGAGLAAFMCKVGNFDGDTDEAPNIYSGRTDAPPYANRGTDLADDVAHYMFKTDLRPDAPGNQNVVTYVVSMGVDHPLLRDTAANSTGGYFVAKNAAELSAKLHAAVFEIIERATSFAAAAIPASRTAFNDGFYSAWFLPRVKGAFWEGHLEAFRLSPLLGVLDKNGNPALDATGTFVEPKLPFWDAGLQLLKASHPPRKLYTTRAAPTRIDFTEAEITAADLNILAGELGLYPNDPLVPFATTEALADAMVHYLDGQDAFDEDRDLDRTEKREAVLGDIFHSNPVVIGPPPLALGHEDGFGPISQPGSFIDTYKSRDRVIYVGSNDGMLHAFDAGQKKAGDNPATPEVENGYFDMGTGNERFGYIPGLLLDQVKFIPRNVPRVHYYVDGSPSASDAWFPSSPVDTTKEMIEWTSVLVGGLRQGGRGYLALDVTDPGATGGAHGPYPKLLWEFDDAAEPLGDSWSKPVITRLKVDGPAASGDNCGPDDGDGDCREQWVAIVGGGFLAEADPNLAAYLDTSNPGWTWDSKAVFIIAIDTGKVLARIAYDSSDPVLSKMQYAVPSTGGVLDLDYDGFADVMYIGDLGGNLWKWDVSDVGGDADADGLVDSADWPSGLFFTTPSTPIPKLGDHYRSIFFAPTAAFVEETLTLAFATGERSNLPYEGDPGEDENNRFYVIKDETPTGPGSIPAATYTEADLTNITGLDDDNDLTDKGYFFVGNDGEKFITNHIIFAGFVITTSYVPSEKGIDLECERSGFTYVHIFDLLNGAGFFADPGGGPTNTRSLKAGVGVPTDPKITTGKNGAQVFIKTSIGQTVALDAPDQDGTGVTMVYWKQDL